MKDARWLEVDADLRSSVDHFQKALLIRERSGVGKDELILYMIDMAFQHAMQAGYTSLENAFERTLEIMGEQKPVGRTYHADLVRRMASSIPGGRPALLPAEIEAAVDELRRFRHVARHGYDGFVLSEAGKPSLAARLVINRIVEVFRDFRLSLTGEQE